MTAPPRTCLRVTDVAREREDGRPAMACVKPLTLLLADDYEANRMVQKAQLEELGYPTDVVANGEEVLRALDARRYDVVLLDIGMPVMDGLETARRIRRQKLDPRPFLVAVTASTIARERTRISAAGFDAVIAKPARPPDFAAVLDQAYARKSGLDTPGVSGAAARDAAPQLDFGALYGRLGPAADGLLRRVIPVYLRELPGRAAGLRAACASQDARALAQLCHGIKGASRILGAGELAATCERLEQRAYDGSLPGAQELDALLELAWCTGEELRRRLDALGA